MKLRRVYVRGVGAITPLGSTWPLAVSALAQGKSAIGPVTRFDVRNFPSTAAAVIPQEFPQAADRRLALAQVAAHEAWRSAGVSAAPERIGIFLGAESGRASLQTVFALAQAAGGGNTFDHRQFGVNARPLAARIDASIASPAAVTSVLAREFNVGGPAETISLACSSGAAAIAEAARAIRLGLCDVAICGGVGADVDPLMLAGFGRVGALSARGVSCPFDVYRDGFVVGEGAAIAILSSEQGSATVEVAGEGRTLDGHHLTAPDPEGKGAIRSMRAALQAANIQAVDYIQAHGTSTPLNDAVEAAAIRTVLGKHLHRAHVSSVKGALGHWIAGAGALGFLCTVEAVATGLLLPTANLTRPDPSCELPHVMGEVVRKNVEAALVNSFAFGGANCSLVVKRCH
ncbi:MAG TPA: beta-ketoacyl-[acyl-carrier-protein] synthase family protein [Burkholderiales bacterium]|jgi:3-oxoacyl-[acyl-carrier-protein] synthase II|nr:beta-ketoacyl-[acyl-carrier-protein] synthase family protein [Burkholderiales bacterium]